ncbi:cytidylate kinase-like family protein [Desulfogranum japonicum]|uniref:cytidylate kinase-like family protein n=1 Tax=Desulfogranum japonicum TaxID=231447 RepID=UPI00041F42E8|nr:cytidylate kinase-like family protein [Desulfogranum japonicum]
MAIITISRGSFSRGKEVAEKLASKLSYTCFSREVLLEASEEFNIPEIRLSRALHDSPSLFERFHQGRILRYMSFYRYALLKSVQQDNVVYHGLAGHFFLRDIPHVFKVRILAKMEDRIKEVMKRDNLSARQARNVIIKDDENRRLWGAQLYGTDTWDSRLYDMVLNIDRLTVDDAVDCLLEIIVKPIFQTTAASQRILDDMTLAAYIHTLLIQYSLMVEVKVKDRVASIEHMGDALKSDTFLRERIEEIIQGVDGIKGVRFVDSAGEVDRPEELRSRSL